MTASPLQSLHRLSLALGTSLERSHECRTFVDWLRAEVTPLLSALFVSDADHQLLHLLGASGLPSEVIGESLPMGIDPWRWLQKRKAALPQGERYILPIMLEEQVFGLLAVISAQCGETLSQEQHLLDLALAYLAPILRNIERYEGVERLVAERTAQLQESEERYRYISELISDYAYAFRVEPDGTLRGEWLTESFVRVLGYTIAEIDARGGWQSMCYEEDIPIAVQHVMKVVSGQSDMAEFRFVTRSGEIRWLRDYAMPVWDEQRRRVTRIYGAAQDITETKRKDNLIAALHQAGERLFTVTDVDQIFHHIADVFRELGFSCMLFPYDPQSDRLYTRYLSYESQALQIVERLVGRSHTDYFQPLSRVSEFEDVVRHRKTVFVGDTEAAIRRWLPKGTKALSKRVQKILNVEKSIIAPLIANDQVVGVVAVQSNDLRQDDLEAVAAFAHQVSAAWENLRYVEQLKLEIGQRREAELAVRASEQRFRALIENGLDYISLLDPQGNLLWESPSAVSMLGYGYNAFLGENIMTLIHPNDRTWVQELFGEVVAEPGGRRSAQFRLRHSNGAYRWVEAIASNFLHDPAVKAVVINYRDITNRKRRERELEAEAMLAHALGENHALNTLLDHLLTAACHAVPANQKGTLSLLKDDGHLQVAAEIGYQTEVRGFTFSVNWGYAGRAARQGKPLVIPDVWEDDELRKDSETVIFPEVSALRSAVAVPLNTGGELLGVLCLESEQPHAFSEEDVRILVNLAATASLLIQRARLYEEERRQRLRSESLRRALQAGASLSSSLDFDRVLDRLLEALAEVLPIDSASILLIHPESGEVRVARFLGHSRLDRKARRRVEAPTFDLEKSPLLRWVYENQQPLVIPDVTQNLDWIQLKETAYVRSWMCAPIVVNNEIIGFFTVDHCTPNAYTNEHIQLLQAFSGQASLAIQNARLFQETQRQSEKLAAVNALGRALASTLDISTLCRKSYQHIRQMVDCDNFGISQYDDETRTLRMVYLLSDGQESDVSLIPPLSIDPHAPHQGRTEAILDARIAFLNDLPQKLRKGKGMLIGDEREPLSAVYTPMLVEGRVVGLLELQSYRAHAYGEDDVDLLQMIANHIGLALQNARLYESTKHSAEETAALLETSMALSSLDLQATLQIIGERAQKLFAADGCRIFLLEPEGTALRCVLALGENFEAFANLKINLGDGITGSVAASGVAEIVNDMANDPRSVQVQGTPEEIEAIMFAPLRKGSQTIGVISIRRLGRQRPFQPQELELLKAFASLAASAVYNSRLFNEIQQRLHELETLQSVSSALRQARTVQEMLPIFIKYAARAVGAQAGSIYLLEETTGDWVSPGWVDVNGKWVTPSTEMRHRSGEGVTGWVGASGEAYITVDWRTDAVNLPLAGEMELLGHSKSGISLPLHGEDRVIGVFHIWYREEHTFSEAEKRLLTAIADMAGSAIQRARLHEEAEQRVQQFQALYDIDRAISSSLDPRISFAVILEQTRAQLGVDACGILLFNPNTSSLEYAAGQGFRYRLYEHSNIRLGDDGAAGESALRRKSLFVDNLWECTQPFNRLDLLNTERFVSYAVTPLVAKGQIKGVLEVFHRFPLRASPDWLNYFEALAQQAAIAIDNAQLFESLQRTHLNLSLAYDATIAALSGALDLRDKETEGHTQRVTDLTIRLARELSIPEEQLVHIRRGALLHDIGKLGVPDAILFKPGPLTEEEWELMRRHPQSAYEMLLPIQYLHPALDIPHYHHEKWDGTGYPLGLKESEIPLAARLFALADVWDALTSDRPYRKAWSRQKALEYIREQAGKHFDPKIVEAFLRLMSE